MPTNTKDCSTCLGIQLESHSKGGIYKIPTTTYLPKRCIRKIMKKFASVEGFENLQESFVHKVH